MNPTVIFPLLRGKGEHRFHDFQINSQAIGNVRLDPHDNLNLY
jgi:hypothetical protein